MTNDQFPSAGESFPGMIDPIIARRVRPRNFEPRTLRFPRVFANRSSWLDDSYILKKMSAHNHRILWSFTR